MRYQKEVIDWQCEDVMMQHNNMLNKLANLESVFIGDQDEEIEPGTGDDLRQ